LLIYKLALLVFCCCGAIAVAFAFAGEADGVDDVAIKYF